MVHQDNRPWHGIIKKKIAGKINQSKSSAGRRAIVRDAERLKQDVFIRVISLNSTTSVFTVEGVWITYQLVWLVATLIG